MPDPFARVRPGDEIGFSSTAWNAMLDAARAEQGRQSGREVPPLTTTRNAAIVRVKNETGADLSRASVVGLHEPIFLPTDDEDAFLREVCFRGVTPTIPDYWGKFAVLLEPAPQNVVVRAYVSGVCPVMVNVVDHDDTHADVEDSQTGRLISAGDGAAQILWREGDEGYGYGYDTGLQWAVVRVGNRGRRCVAASTSVIGKRSGTTLGSGTAMLYYLTPSGVMTSTSHDKTVYNMSTEKSVKSGVFFQYKYDFGQLVVDWADCGDLS